MLATTPRLLLRRPPLTVVPTRTATNARTTRLSSLLTAVNTQTATNVSSRPQRQSPLTVDLTQTVTSASTTAMFLLRTAQSTLIATLACTSARSLLPRVSHTAHRLALLATSHHRLLSLPRLLLLHQLHQLSPSLLLHQ